MSANYRRTFHSGSCCLEVSFFLTLITQTFERLIFIRMHVFSDIRPYICTFSHCKAADRLETFATRAEWWNHELRNHLNRIFNIHSEDKQIPAGTFFQTVLSE